MKIKFLKLFYIFTELAEVEEIPIAPVKSTKEPSAIWDYAKLKGNSIIHCKLCQKYYAYHVNTTNMLKHLKMQHKMFFTPKPSADTKTSKQTRNQRSIKRHFSSDSKGSESSIEVAAKKSKPSTVRIFLLFYIYFIYLRRYCH